MIRGRTASEGALEFYDDATGETVLRVGPDGAGGLAFAWEDITGRPAAFPPTIGATAVTAVAGNDARLSAGAAGTATVRALGTGATQAAAGNHTHTGLLTGSASAVADATDEASAVTQLNALLAVLRGRGVISGG